MADEDLASFFDESWTDDPSLGFTESQAAGIKADFAAIAEEKFFQANGDAERAKALALDEMKRLYGVTRITGAPVVMKHPPERYWPTSTLMTDSAGFFTGPEKTLGYAKAQLRDDILGIDPEADTSTVQFITLPRLTRW